MSSGRSGNTSGFCGAETVRFTVLMTLDCVVVEFRCDSDLWSVRPWSVSYMYRQLACMRMSWCIMFATRFRFPISHVTPGHSTCGLHVQIRRPKGRPLSSAQTCAEPCALLVAEGWSLPLILHLIPSALKGSAKVERLRPRLIASRDAVNRGVKNEQNMTKKVESIQLTLSQKTTGSFSG